MCDLVEQIGAALPVPVVVKTIDMTAYGRGVLVEVYSNGTGRTVKTEHAATDGVEAIVAAHMAARDPKSQKKARQIEARVHRNVFGR